MCLQMGYLLGLGDRHLDNMLIDFSSGHVVHVDFSFVDSSSLASVLGVLVLVLLSYCLLGGGHLLVAGVVPPQTSVLSKGKDFVFLRLFPSV